ncbi:putative cysteine-rich receptor-like protein kinase 9 [Miscanthus floridulus]|uniref:putative cysteine-rich receptor-like protein kinase 9 n=1 Tax=Miscanthus floridulus TaxID=154761 RepID=UPI0034577947
MERVESEREAERAEREAEQQRMAEILHTFQANLAKLSYELLGNAKASGFALRAFGDAPYTAYGLVLCRRDFLGDQCVLCLALVLNLALSTMCVGSRDATVYYDQCLFRFSDRDFLSSYDNLHRTTWSDRFFQQPPG